MSSNITSKIAFGGGCHWCTEAVFDVFKGVYLVEQGWISSDSDDASTPSEAVIVHYDEKAIELDTLIEVHLLTHNATSNHTFRKKYRSAIYTFSESQQDEAQRILTKKQALFEKPLITKVYPFQSFKLNEEKFLNYYKQDPSKPFCKSYIEPKLQMLMKKYSKFVKLVL
ncbi:MAG: Peptide methionine sulfoxide reductase MsrA (EC [uncultured Sulfurovum sp.]|uniref:peptide-methionine (S)-S-oxide reductase n=1 Tax=uncultured Sulfurovum sp. TaxID=269237 RepID=A0A6S6S1H1_9BACT|nr:MAG: Peptide methionine sulfoxide reductase MsrA (EC [uncultured Sulfurovum sp.]